MILQCVLINPENKWHWEGVKMTGERWDDRNANKSSVLSTQQEPLCYFSFHKRYNQNESQAVYIFTVKWLENTAAGLVIINTWLQ